LCRALQLDTWSIGVREGEGVVGSGDRTGGDSSPDLRRLQCCSDQRRCITLGTCVAEEGEEEARPMKEVGQRLSSAAPMAERPRLRGKKAV
jgi:hypothetical protein